MMPVKFFVVVNSVIFALLCSNVAVAQNLQELFNRIAIQEGIANYSYHWDSKNSARFAELFTEDGIMERWINDSAITGSIVKGKQAILNYAINAHTKRLVDKQSRHHVSNIVFIELNAFSAVTEHMALITHQTAESGKAFINGSGIYRISWSKTEQGWKIARRILITDTPPATIN